MSFEIFEGIVQAPTEEYIRRGIDVPLLFTENSGLVTLYFKRNVINVDVIGARVRVSGKCMVLEKPQVRFVEVDDFNIITPSNKEQFATQSLVAKVGLVGSAQPFTKSLEKVSFLILTSVKSDNGNKSDILVLNKSALGWIPFIVEDQWYSISGTKRVKLEDSNHPLAKCEVRFNFPCSDIKMAPSVPNDTVDLPLQFTELVYASAIESSMTFPKTVLDRDNFSRRAFTVDGVVKRYICPDWIELDASFGSAIYILTSHLSSGILSTSLRTGARIRFSNIYTVYLWGRLVAFAGFRCSRVEIIQFSDLEASNKVVIPPSMKFKSSVYVAWNAYLYQKLETALPWFHVTKIREAIETTLDLSLIRIKKEDVSPLPELKSPHYIPFFYVQGCQDCEVLSGLLPDVSPHVQTL